ncbi:MAG TPA: peptide ABC transporter ATP-binding protein [Gammaproteobacteria bacterium]
MKANTIVEAESLARYYPVRRGFFARSRTLRALDGVSFSLAAGETLAVVGESGCGKSTLARQITLIEAPTAGVLKINGRDVTRASREEARFVRRNVQMVFQDPFGSLNPRKKIGSILEEPLVINTSRPRTERREMARDMMARVGLRPEHYSRYPHMFSGGQRQRIAIARSLMLNPSVVVADEPVSALDVSIQAQVLNLLMDLQAAFQLAYIFISHDLSVVRHIADEVMVMYLGRPVEQGAKKRIFDSPRHPYTQALLAATPHVDPALRRVRVPLAGELPSPLNPPTGCAFNSRCPYATDQCRQVRPELRKLDGRYVACHRAENIPV